MISAVLSSCGPQGWVVFHPQFHQVLFRLSSRAWICTRFTGSSTISPSGCFYVVLLLLPTHLPSQQLRMAYGDAMALETQTKQTPVSSLGEEGLTKEVYLGAGGGSDIHTGNLTEPASEPKLSSQVPSQAMLVKHSSC